MPQQIPVTGGVTLQNVLSEVEGFALVRLGRNNSGGRAFKAPEDAVPHLRGSLVGERQGHDFFRVFNDSKQSQKALGQQFRFPGPGRRLNDE